MQIKSWQSHQINEILPRKFCGIPAKLLRKKNKTCLGFEVWPACYIVLLFFLKFSIFFIFWGFFQIGRWDGSLSVDHISFSIVEGRATAAFSLMRRWSVKKWCKVSNQSRECDFLVPSCLTFNIATTQVVNGLNFFDSSEHMLPGHYHRSIEAWNMRGQSGHWWLTLR